jgi:hypothetical protein
MVNVMVINFHERNNFMNNVVVYYNCDFLLRANVGVVQGE